MSKTITSVLGNQQHELIRIEERNVLVIYGRASGTMFAIVPGWYIGNEKHEGNQLTAVDVELVDPLEQPSVEQILRSKFENGGRRGVLISFWGATGFQQDADSSGGEHSGDLTPRQKVEAMSTIMIIDDDPGIRGVIKIFLEKEGFKVLAASNTDEAKKRLKNSVPIPNLILLDIMMPGSTGWQLLKELEKDPEVSKVPVIAISGLEKPKEGTEHDSKMLYDYLVKPFSMQELARVVRKFSH